MSTINSRVAEVIARQLRVSEHQVTPSASLAQDLGADSLKLVELVMTLEDEFRIEIPDEDAETITTVQQAEEYVDRAVRGGESD